MVLPKMEEQMIKRIRQKISDFIWNGAKPKISYNTLIKGKKDGGVALCDLEIKDKALKLCWLQILSQDQKLSNIVYNNISSSLKENIWNCSLKRDDVRYLETSPFWSQVLEAWADFKEITGLATPPNKIVLWLNSDIRIRNRPFCWKRNIERGLLYVSQLISNGRFISARKAYDDFNLSIMEYNAILSAIPVKLKNLLKNQTVLDHRECDGPTPYDMYKERDKLSAYAYGLFIKDKDCRELTKKANDWNAEANIPKNLWEHNFAELYSITNSVKYRSFQFRLLHRAVTLNSHLYRWHVKENNLCTFCGTCKETYTHLFVMCPMVRKSGSSWRNSCISLMTVR